MRERNMLVRIFTKFYLNLNTLYLINTKQKLKKDARQVYGTITLVKTAIQDGKRLMATVTTMDLQLTLKVMQLARVHQETPA